MLAAPANTDPLVQISSERSGITLAFDSNRKTNSISTMTAMHIYNVYQNLVCNFTPPNSLMEKGRGNMFMDGLVETMMDMVFIVRKSRPALEDRMI